MTETAIIGVLATLLGILVGSLLTERREHRTWLRDQKLEAYSALVGLVEFADNIRTDVLDIERLEEYQKKHNALLGKISLIGSQDMAIAAGDLHKVGVRIYGVQNDAELHDAMRAITTQLLKTIQIARKELGLPTHRLTLDE